MKRITKIALIVLYLQSIVGLTIVNHYCGGELAWQSFSIFQELNDCGCGDQEQCGCCETVLTSIQLTDLHYASSGISGFIEQDAIAIEYYTDNHFSLRNENVSPVRIYELPPGSQPAFILNRALLI